MVNSLYYTFSTIAQSLAGAIGLLGAFVLFRLQSLKGEIETDARQISTVVDSVLGGDDARNLFRNGRYRDLLKRLGEITVQQSTYQCADERARLSLLLDRKDSVLRRFKVALYLTVGLIMTSVSILVSAEPLARCAPLATSLFVLGLLLLAACLASYVALMHESLK